METATPGPAVGVERPVGVLSGPASEQSPIPLP
jgi:hypothetical protein